MESVSAFLALNGYGIYVWPAFAFALGVLGGLGLTTWRRLREAERALGLAQAMAEQDR